jgi:hypothetical protein
VSADVRDAIELDKLMASERSIHKLFRHLELMDIIFERKQLLDLMILSKV